MLEKIEETKKYTNINRNMRRKAKIYEEKQRYTGKSKDIRRKAEIVKKSINIRIIKFITIHEIESRCRNEIER